MKVATRAAGNSTASCSTSPAVKVVVAVVDTTRGPVLRTSPADGVTERTEWGPDDRVLRLLVRRTPSPAPGGKRGGVAGGRAQSGHARGATHRPTGK